MASSWADHLVTHTGTVQGYLDSSPSAYGIARSSGPSLARPESGSSAGLHALQSTAKSTSGRKTVDSSRGLGARGSGPSESAEQGLDQDDNVKVVARIRPLNEREHAANDTVAVSLLEPACSQLQVTTSGGGKGGGPLVHNMAFHGCLGPKCRQADVMKACGVSQLLDAALAGYNVTIFAYGQTGSGKTFTMSGREDVLALENYSGDSDDGIITRSVLYLYDQIAKAKACMKYTFKASYCEIYNEQVYDLLKFTKQALPVKWEPRKGFHVGGLHIRECKTLPEMLQVISKGMRHRRMGSHELNLESSRSHSIMTVYCDCTATGEEAQQFSGKISFVDLAGSERLKDSKSCGEALKETSSINRSLFTLGKVISALAENGGDGGGTAHIPYRDSKLTKLLMDSLGGSALALMIACCSPSAAHSDETLSTLTYALRAKNIRNRPVVQVDPQHATIASLSREVQLLRAENAYLRGQVSASMSQSGTATPGSVASFRSSGSGAPSSIASSSPAWPPSSFAQMVLPRSIQSMPPSGSTLVPATSPENASPPPPQSGMVVREDAPQLLHRLSEAETLLDRFSRENQRLAVEVGQLRSNRQYVDHDYKSALEEVDWLRSRLENLETSLMARAGGAAVTRVSGSTSGISTLGGAQTNPVSLGGPRSPGGPMAPSMYQGPGSGSLPSSPVREGPLGFPGSPDLVGDLLRTSVGDGAYQKTLGPSAGFQNSH
eukprot:jgi/Botrbrau1/3782/Bobra.0183s0017.1